MTKVLWKGHPPVYFTHMLQNKVTIHKDLRKALDLSNKDTVFLELVDGDDDRQHIVLTKFKRAEVKEATKELGCYLFTRKEETYGDIKGIMKEELEKKRKKARDDKQAGSWLGKRLPKTGPSLNAEV